MASSRSKVRAAVRILVKPRERPRRRIDSQDSRLALVQLEGQRLGPMSPTYAYHAFTPIPQEC
jgi:hypothetical protein